MCTLEGTGLGSGAGVLRSGRVTWPRAPDKGARGGEGLWPPLPRNCPREGGGEGRGGEFRRNPLTKGLGEGAGLVLGGTGGGDWSRWEAAKGGGRMERRRRGGGLGFHLPRAEINP